MFAVIKCAQCKRSFPIKPHSKKRYCDDDCRREHHRQSVLSEMERWLREARPFPFPIPTEFHQIPPEIRWEVLGKTLEEQSKKLRYFRMGCLAVGSSPRWFPTRKSQGIAYVPIDTPVEVKLPWPGIYLIAQFDANFAMLAQPMWSIDVRFHAQSVILSMGSETPNAEYKG